MRVLSKHELHERSVMTLGLDPEACDLTFTEAIAASLRRAAGFLCPCSHRTLIQAVMEPLDGIVDNRSEVLQTIENTLEAIIAYGDLLEEFEVSVVERSNRGSLVYAAPPSFVWRESGSVLLVGIVPDQRSPLPSQLEQRIQYTGHTRLLIPEVNESLRTDLKSLGLIELSMDLWNKKAPPCESFETLIQRFDNMLRPNPGSLIDLKILNYAKPVNYYPGRWENLGNQTGRFVARRPQAYGNDLWCYVELRNGQAEGLVDMPTLKSRLRGCDEAWRLQAAIDAARGQPEQYKVRTSTDNNTRVVDFFSPVPLWAQRRWDAIGEPVPRSGCLFSYKFSADELQQELKFIQEQLWLGPAF
jgi:hypothetical protein